MPITIARSMALTGALMLTLSGGAAVAANWQAILATEQGRPDTPIALGGFVQVYAETIIAEPVRGLEAPALQQFDGQRAVFNTNGDSSATSSLLLRRARPVIRGAVPGTQQRINYFLAVEFGRVGLTRGQAATIADASFTLSYIPGARIRVGQFKLPLMDESLESNPQVAAFINFSTPVQQLMLESQIVGGEFIGGAYGFRDLGVQVFDWFRFGAVELAYALVGSQGRAHGLDVDDFKDISGRLQATLVFDGKDNDLQRQEISVFGWGQWGKRRLEAGVRDRVRAGGGVQVQLRPLRFRSEVVFAQNALILGPTPAFLGQPIDVAADGKALGYYAQLSWQALTWLSLHLRYDALHRQYDGGPAARLFRTASAGVEVNPHQRLRLVANLDWRWLDASAASADAQHIAATMGPRVTVQGTINF